MTVSVQNTETSNTCESERRMENALLELRSLRGCYGFSVLTVELHVTREAQGQLGDPGQLWI